MSTGIIILNYNGADETLRCLQSICGHNSASVKYFIVDNGSTVEGEVHDIESYIKSAFQPGVATLIASKTNDGYAAGNNKGLRAAFEDPDIEDILILNNDVFFESDLIPELVACRDQLASPGILTPVLYNPDGSIEHNCARTFPSNWEVMLPFILFKKDMFRILSRTSRSQKMLRTDPELINRAYFPIGMPSGACMFMSKSLLMEMGGLDEGTFLYYEENILCKRLSDKGFLNYCLPALRALHAGGASTSKSPNLFLQKCNLESAGYYLEKYGEMTLLQRAVWRIVRQLWRLKFRIKERSL
ncbi:MAG: glycosyltransferase family 2 protein [Bacteroidales bacterium]|nr:glycosyltransferase family 2 protein [Bacteroidales bacterium]